MNGPVRIALLILGGILTIVLCWVALQRKRMLDKRVHDFLEEQSEKGPVDPYLALAELYAEEEDKNQKARNRQK